MGNPAEETFYHPDTQNIAQCSALVKLGRKSICVVDLVWSHFSAGPKGLEIIPQAEAKHLKEMVAKLKSELYRLKKELKDDDQFAYEQPPHEVGPQLTPKRKK